MWNNFRAASCCKRFMVKYIYPVNLMTPTSTFVHTALFVQRNQHQPHYTVVWNIIVVQVHWRWNPGKGIYVLAKYPVSTGCTSIINELISTVKQLLSLIVTVVYLWLCCVCCGLDGHVSGWHQTTQDWTTPTGPHQTGSHPTGPYQTGPHQTGPHQTGPYLTGQHQKKVCGVNGNCCLLPFYSSSITLGKKHLGWFQPLWWLVSSKCIPTIKI